VIEKDATKISKELASDEINLFIFYPPLMFFYENILTINLE
tara:strand:+ start:226 stop:348 length:123 start_codon:yes stop_codon:yes gene_type:complete